MVPTIVLYVYIYISLSLFWSPLRHTLECHPVGRSRGWLRMAMSLGIGLQFEAQEWVWSKMSDYHLIIWSSQPFCILQLDLTQPHGPWRTMAFFSFDLQGTKTSWWHRAQGVSGFFSCAKMVPEFWGYDETDPFLVDNKFATICKLRPGSLVLRKKFSVFFFKFEQQVPMMKCCMSDSLDSLYDCIQWPSCSPRYLSLALESFAPI